MHHVDSQQVELICWHHKILCALAYESVCLELEFELSFADDFEWTLKLLSFLAHVKEHSIDPRPDLIQVEQRILRVEDPVDPVDFSMSEDLIAIFCMHGLSVQQENFVLEFNDGLLAELLAFSLHLCLGH